MGPRISIITLGVTDLIRSTKFYQEGLGLPLGKNSNKNISFFETKGAWLALYPIDKLAEDAKVTNDSKGFSGVTIAHNVKTRGEVNKIMKRAETIGAIITDPAHMREWGGYSGYFKDLDGYLWEIVWSPNSELE